MTEKYGLLIYSQAITSDINPFRQSRVIKELNKGDQFGVGKNGWQELMSHVELTPTNSVVINDRHLFDNEFGKIGYDNVLEALKVLMPKSFQGTFQVSIVCKYPKNLSEETLDEIGRKIPAALKSYFPYKISVELFFLSNTIHKRRIFLGFQTIKCDKGFGLFKQPNLSVVRDDNEFELIPAFSLDNDTCGDTQFAIDSQDLERILKQCKSDGSRYKAKKEKRFSDQVLLIGEYDQSSYSPSNKLLLSK